MLEIRSNEILKVISIEKQSCSQILDTFLFPCYFNKNTRSDNLIYRLIVKMSVRVKFYFQNFVSRTILVIVLLNIFLLADRHIIRTSK